jgi:colanic acid/amylovoran biosynthesis glycosyltransferase
VHGLEKAWTRSLKVVEAFDTYLGITENWSYKLLRNLSGVELLIVSEYRENEALFPLQNAQYKTAFRSRGRKDYPWLLQKVANRLRLMAGWIWKRTTILQIRKADVIHAHFSVVGWDYLWPARVAGTPLVVSFYGFDYEHLPNVKPVWKKRYRKLFQYGSLFLAEGDAGRSKLIKMGCPEHKAKVVHLGVDVARIPAHDRPKKEFELNLVQVARFTDKKGHEVTFEAFVQALQTCPNMTLTLVGKDPDGIRARLEAASSKKGLTRQIRFMDGIDYARLYDFLADYHVFIHPSRYGKHRDCEGGAPIVLLDAQATCMPVLSTFHCDIPDEVVNGQTGILVQENAVEELAAAIQRFYEMDELEYHEYGRRARRHVEQHYQAAQCATELQKNYEILIANNVHRRTLVSQL